MAQKDRTLKKTIKGVWIRILSILAQFTFPAHFTTSIHRMRGVKIGKGTKINRTVQIDDSFPELVTIGNNVWITAGTMILCHQRDLSYYLPGKPVMECPIKAARVTIKDGAHIGIGTIILPGVTIGEGAVIGAGAIVTKDIPPFSVAIGIPAKVIKCLNHNGENENLD